MRRLHRGCLRFAIYVHAEIWRYFVFFIQRVCEVDASDTTVGVHSHSCCFNIVRTVCSGCEVSEIELYLIKARAKTQRHSAYEWLNACGSLIVACSEASLDILIVEDLNLKAKILSHVLYEHDEIGKLDCKCIIGICGARYIVCCHIGSHDLQNARLYVWVCDALYVPVFDCLRPDLQWL